MESGRHDGNERHWHVAYQKGGPHDFGICIEMLLPQSVVHRKNWRGSRLRIFRNNAAAQEWVHPQELKRIGRHKRSMKLQRRLAVRARHIPIHEPDNVFECLALFLEIEKLR